MLKQLIAGLVLGFLAAGPALAAEQVFEPNANGQIEFTMPSGNIGCLYTPEGGTDTYMPTDGGPELICERVEPAYVTVILGPEGPAEMIGDPGEQACCGGGNIFEYGNTLELDGFYCESATTGLSCETDWDDEEEDGDAFAPDATDDADTDTGGDDDDEEDDEDVHGFTMARAGIEVF